MCIRVSLVSYYRRTSAILTLLHSERPKLYTILAFLSAVGLNIITLIIQLCRLILDFTVWIQHNMIFLFFNVPIFGEEDRKHNPSQSKLYTK